MSSRVPVIDAVPTSAEQIAAFRLSRHHLIKRAPASALIQVAGDMGGAPAPFLSAAQISLWARTRSLRVTDVDNALGRDRTPAKSWGIRGALPLIPSPEFAVFLRGSGPPGARAVAR